MKQGGVSWNTSMKKKPGVQTRFVCNECSRQYKMEWARNNHQMKCKEYNKSLEKEE